MTTGGRWGLDHEWRSNGLSRGALLLLAVAVSLGALALTLLLLPPATFAAIYGGTLYPALTVLFAALTSWTYLPLGLAVLPIVCGIFVWRTLSPRRRLELWPRVLRLLLLTLSLSSLYLITWGANYRRPELLRLLDVPERPATQAEIDAFGGELLRWVRAGAAAIDELEAAGSEAGATGDRGTRSGEAVAAIADELEQLGREFGWPVTVPPRLKLLPPGTLLSSGYAGMLFPFTLEPQVDAGLSVVSSVAVGGHEMAHAAGFASESDADMAALIAGLRAPHPLARYATALTLLARTLGSLTPEQRQFVVSNLPPRALRDLTEARERSSRFLNSTLSRRVTAVYDRLLEGQGIEAGVDAYREAPALGALLAAEGVLPRAPLPVPDSGVDDLERPALALDGPPRRFIGAG
ncbi:MAG TPA: DUF3810 family protein [Trueperaceae bacterium]